jgi:hypothetical protein
VSAALQARSSVPITGNLSLLHRFNVGTALLQLFTFGGRDPLAGST